ncbi:hypothetical protein GCK32_000393 [Trichostrongylus colubriformis]|uniref:Uncharacterized protein n=1 Tax=Trichostrongylus colubriformis TaxID=6319 RepID=A0AAN8FAS1_TRICO
MDNDFEDKHCRLNMYRTVNGSIWSNHSVLVFDSYDTFVNCSAQEAESFFIVQNNTSIYAHGNDANFSMRTNRTSDGYSSIVHDLVGNTNVSVENTGLRVQGIHGDRSGIEVDTSQANRAVSMKFAANTLLNGVRQLVLLATSPLYYIRVCFIGATIYVEFGDKIVEIDHNYKTVNVHTDKYTITAKINDSFFDVALSEEEILVRCPFESIMLRVVPSGVNIDVEQLATIVIDRGGGELSLGGSVVAAENIKVTALKTDLNLSNDGLVTGSTTNSHIVVQTPIQNVGMTSGQHNIRVEGGTPHLVIESGQACIEVKTNHGLPQIVGILPPFVTPADIFAKLGPLEALLYTTRAPDVEPQFPRPDELAALELGFNNTRCATCLLNITAKVSTTRLPPHIVPTFPGHSRTVTSATFPTLVSLVTGQTSSFESSHGITVVPPTVATPRTSLPEQPQAPSSPSTVATPGTTPAVPRVTTATIPATTTARQSVTTVRPVVTTISSSTSDQFVIGQFDGMTTRGPQTAASSLSPSPSPTPAVTTAPATAITLTRVVISENEDFPTPVSPLPLSTSSTPPDETTETFPTPASLPSTTGGGGGSWGNVETLFPTPPPSLPEKKPSILVLRMKVPPDIDLSAFDLTSNLTSALSDVVRESVRRVKRTKRSLSEGLQKNLVEVHRIERVGNALNILFSINETEVDSDIVEEDLYSLDMKYLTHFFGFPVVSTIYNASMTKILNFVMIGLSAFAFSVVFFCVVFRSSLKEVIRTYSSRVLSCSPSLRRQERINSITIITDEVLT